MPDFDYIAVDARGREALGRLQAADARAALAQLRQMQLYPVSVEAAAEAGGLNQAVDLGFLTAWRGVPVRDLIFWFRQLSFILRAGLPVLQALELCAAQAGSARLKQVIHTMIADIENGNPLSQAMANHPKVFHPLMVKLVVAGEQTGELDIIVGRLADHLEKKAALRSQTINALIYPTVVVVAGLGVAIFLVVKIIPQFAKFLSGRGKPLPPSTQMLVDISNFVINNGIPILLAILAAVVALVMTYKQPAGRYRIDGILLKFPVIGGMLTAAAMAQMTWSLSMLLRSGLTVLDALRIVSGVIGNRVISDKLMEGAGQILAGRDMAASIGHPAIPTLVTQMVAVGERTGTLDSVLSEMAHYYEELLAVRIKRVSSMIEPALILLIGGMVGFVYYSFFQAMLQLARN